MLAARLAMQTCRNILPIKVQYKNLSPLGGFTVFIPSTALSLQNSGVGWLSFKSGVFCVFISN